MLFAIALIYAAFSLLEFWSSALVPVLLALSDPHGHRASPLHPTFSVRHGTGVQIWKKDSFCEFSRTAVDPIQIYFVSTIII